MKYIMLHGLGQSSESWSDTVKVFNDDFEVLCPNLSDWLSGKTPCYDTLYRTLETSLDKGTQRKTTENELPSLTQCTA